MLANVADLDLELAEVERLNVSVKPAAAEALLRGVMVRMTRVQLQATETDLRVSINGFLPKRRKALGKYLDDLLAQPEPAPATGASPGSMRQGVAPTAGASPTRTSSLTPSALASRPTVSSRFSPDTPSDSRPQSLPALNTAFLASLQDLSAYHIFQWSTFYRDIFTRFSATTSTRR